MWHFYLESDILVGDRRGGSKLTRMTCEFEGGREDQLCIPWKVMGEGSQTLSHTMYDFTNFPPNSRAQRVTEERLLEVEIEIGMRDGQEQAFVGEGEPHVDGEPGDLRFRIRQQKHARFERRGDDLYANMTISLQDALNGFDTTIAHLDGHLVRIAREKVYCTCIQYSINRITRWKWEKNRKNPTKNQQVTWPGTRIRRRDEGMPVYGNTRQRGTMYITFDVNFPKDAVFSDEQKALIQDLLKQQDLKPSLYNGLWAFCATKQPCLLVYICDKRLFYVLMLNATRTNDVF